MLPFRAYDIPGALLSGFLILAACEAGYDGTWLIDHEWNPERISRYGVIAFVIGLVVAAISRRVVEDILVAGSLRRPAEFLLDGGTIGPRDLRRVLFRGYYAPLADATREWILRTSDGGTIPRDSGIREHSEIARSRNAHEFRYAGSLQGSVGASEVSAAGDVRNLNFHLYTTCRTLCLGLLAVGAVLASGIVWHAAVSGWGQAEWRKLGYCLLSLFEAAGMLHRYLKYYRSHAIEELIRAASDRS